jgi:polysaccharide export outer membrane protein
MFNRLLALSGLLFAFAVSACQQAPAPVHAPALAAAAVAAPAVAAPSFDYRLGSGDKLRVIVFGEESLSGEFVVSGSGKISMPLIGETQATGLTVAEFQAEVEKALRDGYLKDPRVSAEVLNYRPFYILGEVKKPGEYPYTNGLTVQNAVARAEGFSYRADQRRVYIKRANETAERQYVLTPSTAVAPGDTIRIAERFF